MNDLQEFRMCGWVTASLQAPALAEVEAKAREHCDSGAVVQTCQRLEVYGRGTCDCTAPEHRYGREALIHLAAVAAGVESVVLGEAQIFAQVRSALAEAPPGIRRAIDLALGAARALRREAGFTADAGHALDRALAVSGTPAGGPLLVLGAGHMARLVATRGRHLGFGPVVVGARRPPAGDWSKKDGIGYLPLDEIAAAGPVDMIVGCLGAGAGEIKRSALPPCNRLIVDLGTPRNFAGTGTPVITIADLLFSPDETERRRELKGRLGELVNRRMAMASDTRSSLVGSLRYEVERLRQEEMKRIRRLHPEVAPATLDVITRSLVNQLFHEPSERLRKIGDPNLGERVVALFSRRESVTGARGGER